MCRSRLRTFPRRRKCSAIIRRSKLKKGCAFLWSGFCRRQKRKTEQARNPTKNSQPFFFFEGKRGFAMPLDVRRWVFDVGCSSGSGGGTGCTAIELRRNGFFPILIVILLLISKNLSRARLRLRLRLRACQCGPAAGRNSMAVGAGRGGFG